MDSARGKTGRSLFWPSGPITAKHTKAREGLLAGKTPVWPKSGAPTTEPRVYRGEVVPALLEGNVHARMVGKSVVSLRRDLNTLPSDGAIRPATLLQGLESARSARKTVPVEDEDELWEALGRPSTSGKQDIVRSRGSA
mmetsp:Transcript_40214/g.92445  ORF Transcript_40214/g.92445 Transcript_40214/m.92445 type:complete len:139 (+) Transcript_40214:73-489(+)|eukprot:6457679-Amphidinium_carterae.1